MVVAFDEMHGADGGVRPAYGELSHWLGEVPPDVLDYRRREAELLFRRIGITFAVYGEAEAQERLIPFDVIPRIMSGAEWRLLEKGLVQRVKALNLFIKDVYGAREILRAGVVPDDLVFRNPAFRPEMSGQSVPYNIYIHIAGIDIVRVDADTFYVLEDNARTPSGVSYMLENREIMMRLFPELFSRHRIAPVEDYPDVLLATLKSVAPSRIARDEDVFGNISHFFTAEGLFRELSISVEGEVDTHDTKSVVAGAVERFPPQMFLRETELTQPDDAIIDFADSTRAAAGSDSLTLLHGLMTALNREIAFDTNPTHSATTAAEAFALRRGVCQDLTHIFIAAARRFGIPARYVGGHFYRIDGVTAQEAGHAWVEAYVENLGWVGFDPTNGIGTTEAHVRVAIGLDYLGAAPVRGTRFGGSGETLKVAVHVAQAHQQAQN